MRFKTISVIDRLGARIRDRRYLRLLKERERLDDRIARSDERHGVMQKIAGRHEHVSGVTRDERHEIFTHLTLGERFKVWTDLTHDRFLTYSIWLTGICILETIGDRIISEGKLTSLISQSMTRESVILILSVIGISAAVKAIEHTRTSSDLFLTTLYEMSHESIVDRLAEEKAMVMAQIRKAAN